jgi:hypothetical protein
MFDLLDPQQVRIDTAETVIRFQAPGSHPLVTRRAVGKGQAWYVAADLFGAYHRRSHYTPWRRRRTAEGTDAMRAFIGELVRQAKPDLPVRIDADPWVETGIRRKTKADLLVQIVDRRLEWKQTPPPTGPVRIDMFLAQRPVEVLLQPGNETLNFEHEKQRLVLEVPADKVGLHRIVEIGITK